jgi:hypothetical protein
MTRSTKVRSELIDIEVASLDDETLIELSNVRTVNQMPISEACIAKKGVFGSWSHLRDLPLADSIYYPHRGGSIKSLGNPGDGSIKSLGNPGEG